MQTWAHIFGPVLRPSKRIKDIPISGWTFGGGERTVHQTEDGGLPYRHSGLEGETDSVTLSTLVDLPGPFWKVRNCGAITTQDKLKRPHSF